MPCQTSTMVSVHARARRGRGKYGERVAIGIASTKAHAVAVKPVPKRHITVNVPTAEALTVEPHDAVVVHGLEIDPRHTACFLPFTREGKVVTVPPAAIICEINRLVRLEAATPTRRLARALS